MPVHLTGLLFGINARIARMELVCAHMMTCLPPRRKRPGCDINFPSNVRARKPTTSKIQAYFWVFVPVHLTGLLFRRGGINARNARSSTRTARKRAQLTCAQRAHVTYLPPRRKKPGKGARLRHKSKHSGVSKCFVQCFLCSLDKTFIPPRCYTKDKMPFKTTNLWSIDGKNKS